MPLFPLNHFSATYLWLKNVRQSVGLQCGHSRGIGSYTDTCFQNLSKNGTHCNETVPIGGDLSSDPASPGLLHEGLIAFNHSVGPKSPTMVFNVKRDASGKAVEMHIYACLGRIPPVIGSPVFSYLLYTRQPVATNAEIDRLVLPDRATGLFDLRNLVYTNSSAWHTCGVR